MSAGAVNHPAILLFHHPDAAPELIEAFLLGCEEEGVPVEVCALDSTAAILARSAAKASTLFVGAGIDQTGALAIHEQRLGDLPPLMRLTGASSMDARTLGVAAGRLVRGRPIKSIVADNNIRAL
jgi:hypothetical protein